MTVDVIHADARDALRDMPDASIDACVTDPPYALVSIAKRYGAEYAAPAKDRDGLYKRASAGFMGKQWDTGDCAFDPEFWRAVLRVLKPGAHLIAFGGTRTYHRLAVAIEDAGFEIRDQLGWLYGSGFPKSHDVTKAIDRRRDWTALPKLQSAIRAARKSLGISQSEAARRIGMVPPGESLRGGGYMWFETGRRMPTREEWPRIKSTLGIGDEFDACFEECEREITGEAVAWTGRSNYQITTRDGFLRGKPASEAAQAWAGWGTALKPAWEPIVFARRPMIGTTAANVLAHGVGALNIDATRIPGETVFDAKRWPANVLHDGSDEVAAALPGDAARFFYSAKADASDRLGSDHPTVKPVDLMAYLIRMVTKPGATVLDPFAGSGTTGMAAMREGRNAVLIERESEYVADIRRRIAHVSGQDAPLFASAGENAP
jgi:DNA modification methylase/transcriptional regulator with XRE-family HTH domain